MLVKPRKASTVALIRDFNGRMEVLLMKRHGDDRFLPGHHVFPGGAVDKQDSDHDFTGCKNKHILDNFENDPGKYYSSVICCIRETFEEAGLLLAEDVNGNYPLINSRESVEKFSRYRRMVFEKKISFRKMLEEENLKPAVEKIYYMNRWITPPLFPIRYDTRFFTAVAPSGQETSHDGNELVDYHWTPPEAALDDYRNNKIKLVMPTIKTLELLSGFKTTGDVIEHYRG